MGRPRSEDVVIDQEYEALSRRAIETVPGAQTLTELHHAGKLIEQIVRQQRRHTTAVGVTRDLARRIGKARAGGHAGCSFSQLNRMYQFARDWTGSEVRQLEKVGVPWRLMIQLLPYRLRARRLKTGEQPGAAASIDKKIAALLKQLARQSATPAHVQVEAWLQDQRGLLAPSRPRVDVTLAKSAMLRLSKVEFYLDKVHQRDPKVIDDWRQTRQAVKHLRKVLEHVEKRLAKGV